LSLTNGLKTILLSEDAAEEKKINGFHATTSSLDGESSTVLSPINQARED